MAKKKAPPRVGAQVALLRLRYKLRQSRRKVAAILGIPPEQLYRYETSTATADPSFLGRWRETLEAIGEAKAA